MDPLEPFIPPQQPHSLHEDEIQILDSAQQPKEAESNLNKADMKFRYESHSVCANCCRSFSERSHVQQESVMKQEELHQHQQQHVETMGLPGSSSPLTNTLTANVAKRIYEISVTTTSSQRLQCQSHQFSESSRSDENHISNHVENQNETKKAEEIQLLKVADILSSVYKLNYLNVVDENSGSVTFWWNQTRTASTNNTQSPRNHNNNIPLCAPCADSLQCLFKAFESFNRLRNMDSYITQKLNQLDEYINSLAVASTSVSTAHGNQSTQQTHNHHLALLQESEELETEIDPASIKVEMDNDNDDEDSNPYYDDFNTDDVMDNLSSSLIQEGGSDSRSSRTSIPTGRCAGDRSGPPWVYIRKLRSSGLNSFSSARSPADGTCVVNSMEERPKRRYTSRKKTVAVQEREILDISDTDSLVDIKFEEDFPTTNVKLTKSRKPPFSSKKAKLSKTPAKTAASKKLSKSKEQVRKRGRPRKSIPENIFIPTTTTNTNENDFDDLNSKSMSEGVSTGESESESETGDDSRYEPKSHKSRIRKTEAKTRKINASKKSSSKKKRKVKGIYAAWYLRKQKVPFPCWYCLLDFPTEPERTEHLHSIHVKKIASKYTKICEPCGKLFQSLKLFEGHLPKCGEPPPGTRLPPFICSHCSKEFNNPRCLKSHEKLVHIAERTAPCKFEGQDGVRCSYIAKTQSQLTQHVKNVHKETQSVTCQLCSTTYKSQLHYNQHYERIHTEEGRKKYDLINAKAAVRDKQVRRRKALTSFVCTKCNNIDFQTKVRLTRHNLAVHVTEKKYVCHICGAGFIESYRLKKHILFTHTEERPYVCDVCGKTFKSIYNLDSHAQNTHDEEGRKRYNEYMRENNRKRMAIAKSIALAATTTAAGPGTSNPMTEPSGGCAPPPPSSTATTPTTATTAAPGAGPLNLNSDVNLNLLNNLHHRFQFPFQVHQQAAVGEQPEPQPQLRLHSQQDRQDHEIENSFESIPINLHFNNP